MAKDTVATRGRKAGQAASSGPEVSAALAPPHPERLGATVEERIRQRAYELWQRSGSGHGSAVDHWLTAEEELRRGAAEQSPAGSADEPVRMAPATANPRAAPGAAAKAKARRV